MAMHMLEPTRENLHGHWSRTLPPILTVEPGDTVRYRVLDSRWFTQRPDENCQGPQVTPRDPVLDSGHCLVGPVAVRGAKAGQTLEVRIDEIVPGNWGWQWSWPRGQRAVDLGVAGIADHVQTWDVDVAAGVARDKRGRVTPLAPFMGVMGVAPAADGPISTTPPRGWGGNLDCRELLAGTSLYLPIGVAGALFSVGDGHAAQGDGEVCGTAIECPMDRLELTFFVHDHAIPAPRARVKDGLLAMGFDPDLNAACIAALNNMLDWMQERLGVNRQEALAVASVAVDLRITQIVNMAQGVHAVWRL
jgi:acetamidase/formamidase